jgi:hypothetical protein
LSEMMRNASKVLGFNGSMQDFTGGFNGLSGESQLMKRALLGFITLIAVSAPVLACEADESSTVFAKPIELSLCPSDVFASVDTSLLMRDLPMLSLMDEDCFANASEMTQLAVAPQEIFPIALIAPAPGKANRYVYLYDSTPDGKQIASAQSYSDAKDFSDSKDTSSMAKPASRWWHSGEVGFMYGASSGNAVMKGDEFHTYGVFEVGDDKTHIVVGASYEENNYNYHFPRGRTH